MSTSTPTRLRSALFHALRTMFRALPLNEARRDAWRQRFLDRFPSVRPTAVSGFLPANFGRRPYVHAGGRALGHVEHSIEPLPDPLPATLVAFYLPQFHTIPENDEWWGKGFTEWRNVTRALPQFEGHAQPRLPGDLGFYDLRNPQVLREQAALAQTYGISAFCMYFYWFGGRPLLELPVQQWLDDASIDFPICLCWANENWTRTWDGRAGEVLIAQQHSAKDDLAFIAHVAKYLRDPRYLRIDGKPLLLVYRPGLLPDARATAQRWRTWCRDHGVGEIVLAYVQSFDRMDPHDLGFDAAVEFPPNLSEPTNIAARQTLLNPDFSGQVLDWRELAQSYRKRPMPAYRLFPGVNCGWDNEPRRPGQGRVYLHSSPRLYREWLSDTIHLRLAGQDPADKVVFINAWNEWAEGAVLEPDVRLGHAWLQATRESLQSPAACLRSSKTPCLVLHSWYLDVLPDMLTRIQNSGVDFRIIATTTPDKAEGVRRIFMEHGISAEFEVAENHGRDILPFLRVAHRLVEEGEDVVLKLHTKRSKHRKNGDEWRTELLERLLDPTRAARVIEAFAHDPSLGIVGPEGHLQPLSRFMGGNSEALRYLTARTGLGEINGDTEFFAGSMFWIRLKALRPLLNSHLSKCEFESEAGQIDGTLAHAVERIMVLSAKRERLKVTTVAAVSGKDDTTSLQPYQYAGEQHC